MKAVDPKTGRRTKVAIIGGVIAGSGSAYALSRGGFDVTLYEARDHLSGNAHTFDWEGVGGKTVRSCVSVTAWPAELYKNYVALLRQLNVETTQQTLSWVLNSKVPGYEGTLWAADPDIHEHNSLRKMFYKDFSRYSKAVKFADFVTRCFTLKYFTPPPYEPSMYSIQSGTGIFNPLATLPLHHLCRMFGVSQKWWDIIFTPHYTASFLADKLDNLVCVAAPILEKNIPMVPVDGHNISREPRLTLNTCETWADAGRGIQEVFEKLTKEVTVKLNTRVLKVVKDKEATAAAASPKLTLVDEYGGSETYDRVIFACAANAVGNIHEEHNWIADAILGAPEYADDHHPSSGHMHAVMHTDASIIPAEIRDEVLRRGSNYVEVTQREDGSLNIENTYNFGVQTPEAVKLDISEKPPMLITHALGDGKTIDPKLIKGTGNHARAHPLYSGWNVAAVLLLRFIQGKDGIFYCCNWTTPGNCHDMSLLSGLVAAHAAGAPYPFEGDPGPMSDFGHLRGLMGI